MGANDIQIGGDHYKNKPYQHWDFVIDTGLHYLLACTTKYVARWREKNGIEDLRKSLHYLNKAKENGITAPLNTTMFTLKFCNQLTSYDAHIIINIMKNNMAPAITQISNLISNEVSDANKNYVDQD